MASGGTRDTALELTLPPSAANITTHGTIIANGVGSDYRFRVR